MPATDFTDPVQAVRLEIGDASSSTELSDDFIEGVLAVTDDDTLWAAEKCAWYQHTKYAREVDRSEGGPGSIRTKTEHQARAAAWFKIFLAIRKRRGYALAAPEALGTEAQISAAASNASIAQPTFFRRQFDRLSPWRRD